MRPQARQFSVEIKSRKRPTSPAIAASAAARQDDWADLIPPDDVPERDVNEDLTDPSVQSEARREAERLFGRLGDAQPVEPRKDTTAPVPPEAAPPPARVLPDLLAETREQERQKVEKPERTRAAKTPRAKRPRKRVEAQIRLEPPAPVTPQQTSPSPVLTARAQAAVMRGRRGREAGKRLPPGQRWKERRLPRACWDR